MKWQVILGLILAVFFNPVEVHSQTAQQVIDQYVQALGGRDRVASMIKVQTSLSAQYLGNTMYITDIREYPNKTSSATTVNGVEIYREEYNGQTGYVVNNGIRQELTGELLEIKKYTSIFNEYLYYDQYGIDLEYIGIVPYNFKNYHQVLKISPTGSNTYMYFDAQTGLLYQTVEDEETSVIYTEYRPVQGIMVPHQFSTSSSIGEILMTVVNVDITFRSGQNLAQNQISTQNQTYRPPVSRNEGPDQPQEQSQPIGNAGNIANTTPEADYQHKYALVIGNSNYKTAPLRNPANDARAMTTELQNLGFDVMGYTDLSRKEMRDAIHKFGDKIMANKGVGLFYYAGHGLQAKGINYLIPVDATIEKEYDIEDECVKADMVLRMMELYQNPMNIIILDACRNNPFSRNFRSVDQGLAQPASAPTGSIIAFATAPGKTASDGDGQNGLYTQELIKAMRKQGLTIEQVFKQVRINVLNLSDDKQSPWENSSLVGDFYFKR